MTCASTSGPPSRPSPPTESAGVSPTPPQRRPPASGGGLGLVLGFGAQDITRDLLAGVFLLSEGLGQVGDIVRVDGDVGTVERVSIRITQIRKFSGELLTIPNGAITRIGNLSRDY